MSVAFRVLVRAPRFQGGRVLNPLLMGGWATKRPFLTRSYASRAGLSEAEQMRQQMEELARENKALREAKAREAALREAALREAAEAKAREAALREAKEAAEAKPRPRLGDNLADIVEWNERNHFPWRENPEKLFNYSPMLNRDAAVALVVETAEKLVSAYNTGSERGKKESYALLDAIMGSGLGKTTAGRFFYDHLRLMFEDKMPVKFLYFHFNGDINQDTLMDKTFFLVKEADPAVQQKAEYSAEDARMALRLFGAITGTPVYRFLKAHKGEYELKVTVEDVFRFARKRWGVPDNKPVMVFVHMDEIQTLDRVLKTATEYDDPLIEFRKVRAFLTDYLFDGTFSRALEMHVLPVLMMSGLTADKVTAGEFSHSLTKCPVPLPRLREADFEVLFKWRLRNRRAQEVDGAAFAKLFGRADVQQLVRDCAGHPRLIILALMEFDPAWLEDISRDNVEYWSTRTLNSFKGFYRLDHSMGGAKTFNKQFGNPRLLVRVLVSGVTTSAWHVQWSKCGIVWRTGEARINAPFFTLRALCSSLSSTFAPSELPTLPRELFGARLWYWQDFERAELYIDALRTAELRAGETEENRVCTVGDLYTGAIWSKSSRGERWEVCLPERMTVKEDHKQVCASEYDFEAMVDKNVARYYKEMHQCAQGNPGVDSWTLRKSATDAQPDVICLKQSKHTGAQKRTTINKSALQEMVAGMTRAAAKVASYRRVLLIVTNRSVAEDAVEWLRCDYDAGADVCVGLICARNLAEYVPPVFLERARHADDRSGGVWDE